MTAITPQILLDNPELVEPLAPWCVILDNLELGILLVAQPWLAVDGLRRRRAGPRCRNPGRFPDRARLLTIGVAPGWRSRGVAVAMGRALTDVLLRKGYQTLEASWVLRDNTRPQALARALGARETRRFELLAWHAPGARD